MSVPYNFADFENSFGYYEIDNHKKYSICLNPNDKRIYAKSAHYRWERYDTDDEIDLPSQRVKLAKDNIGCEIMLNATGIRDTTESAAYFDKVESVNIPRKFQQIPYEETAVFGYLLVY